MNREIRFRMWDGMKIRQVNALFSRAAGMEVNPPSDDDLYNFHWKEPIMQFTGLKDKNGKDIYEGDIIEEELETEYGKDNLRHEVSFNAGAFYPICMQPSTTFKIIGNIYENPELLNS